MYMYINVQVRAIVAFKYRENTACRQLSTVGLPSSRLLECAAESARVERVAIAVLPIGEGGDVAERWSKHSNHFIASNSKTKFIAEQIVRVTVS